SRHRSHHAARRSPAWNANDERDAATIVKRETLASVRCTRSPHPAAAPFDHEETIEGKSPRRSIDTRSF
ncbi:MAG TPA: hypothetical protein VNL37_02040, partial [Candidatus Polarisedimenticolia bacterium]|nr:hypothetical protein [Candidatus Polarisedimenticolia bacterium]